MTLTFSPEKYGSLLSQYQPKLIKTEEENERALMVIEQLMYQQDRSSEENELYELLIALVEKFEQEFYQPGSRSTPHSMLQFLMEQQGTTTVDLAEVLGSEVEAILKGEREMSIAQIKSLSQLFKVEPSVFL